MRVGLFLPLVLAAAACAPIARIGSAPVIRAPKSLPSNASLPATLASWPRDRWWASFGDAQLDTLVDEGLASSPDIAAAAARIASANALAQQAGAALGPSLATDGSIGATKQSENLGIPPAFVPDGVLETGRVTATASFNFDL